MVHNHDGTCALCMQFHEYKNTANHDMTQIKLFAFVPFYPPPQPSHLNIVHSHHHKLQ